MKIKEKFARVYFDNKTMRVFKDIVDYRVDTWIHMKLTNDDEVIVNPERVLYYISRGRKHSL